MCCFLDFYLATLTQIEKKMLSVLFAVKLFDLLNFSVVSSFCFKSVFNSSWRSCECLHIVSFVYLYNPHINPNMWGNSLQKHWFVTVPELELALAKDDLLTRGSCSEGMKKKPTHELLCHLYVQSTQWNWGILFPDRLLSFEVCLHNCVKVPPNDQSSCQHTMRCPFLYVQQTKTDPDKKEIYSNLY